MEISLTQLIYFWQTIPDRIDPVLIAIGSFQIRYYSLMYLLAFYVTYRLVIRRIYNEGLPYLKETILDAFVWAIVGLLIGARFGYVLMYNPGYFLLHPLEIVLPFTLSDGFRYVGISGMSYHGGLVGVIVATLLFCARHKIDFWQFADLMCAEIPLGYTFGRIGNFLNGELYGRVTDVAWGMYFPADPYLQLRHPSQLYEAFFEGIFLFVILWHLRNKADFSGFILSLYIIGYGTARFCIEFFRQPDPQIGFVLGPLSMGQLLCFLMVLLGVALLILRKVISSL